MGCSPRVIGITRLTSRRSLCFGYRVSYRCNLTRPDERKFSEVWASFPVFLEATNRDAGRAELGHLLKGDRPEQDFSAVKGASRQAGRAGGVA